MALNRGFEFRELLGSRALGATLLEYLTLRYAHSSWSKWNARIAEGLVRLDGRRVTPGVSIRPGQTLTWTRPPWHEPPAPRGFAVLHLDRDLLAVAKPAGLPTLPGGGFLERTLLSSVQRHYPTATPMHRLGRWTSGIVLFARTSDARAAVARSWREGRVRKRYRALASGTCPWERFRIEQPIGPEPYPPLGTLHAISAKGKAARSEVELAEQRPGEFLADVLIVTGRPHQIRIHLAAIGCPLVGDPLYVAGGRPAPDCRALPGDPGYKLHAARLWLDHPRGGGPIEIVCEPPPELRRGSKPGASI